MRLVNFRNYKDEMHNFHPQTNIFVGSNAQGKTNLLESVYYCSRGRSFKQVRDSDIILEGKPWAKLDAQIIKNQSRRKLIHIGIGKEKKIQINGIEIDSLKEMSYQFEIVYFWPDHLKIIKEGPSLRRELIDEAILGMKPRYRSLLSRYSSLLNHRNALLKKKFNTRFFKEQVSSLTRELADIGAKITIIRSAYAEVLLPVANRIHKRACGGENLHIKYQNFLSKEITEDEDSLSLLMYEKIMESLDTDISKGYTRYGPHRDDLKITINDRDIKVFASQGQQRSAILSIKLGEINLIKGTVGISPIFLLDDVFSELDENRRMAFLNETRGIQTLITTNSFPRIKDSNVKINKIEEGMIIDDIY